MPRKQQDNPQQLSLDLSDWLATPPAEPPSVPSPVSSRFALAQALSEMLLGGEELSARRLALAASDVFGGTQAEGKWLGKDAYDAMEVAVNLYLRDREASAWTALDAHGAAEKVQALTALVQRLPTQTRRDEEMDELQQFSTPPALAFVANWVANVSAADIVLEPSAGTGDLAIWSQLAGADLVLNELSERRRALLADLFPDAALTGENAEQLHNVLPRGTVPSVVVMNPPFSSSAGRIPGERKTMNGARHLEQALLRLADNGRLVAIVGEGMGPDRPTFRPWWRAIESRYRVRANVGISGREYAKYGTAFDNRLIVIDKTGPTQSPPLTGAVASVADLPSLLEATRHARRGLHRDEQPRAEPTGRADSRRASDSLEPPVAAGEPRADSSRSGGRRHRGADDLRAPAAAGEAVVPPRGGDAPDDDNGLGGAVRDRAGRGPGRGGSADSAGDPGVDHSPGTDGAPLAIEADIAPEAEAPRELSESVFTQYRPQRLSIPGAHAHPGRLVQSAAMGAVEPPAPAYSPMLPASVVHDGLLSLAQLETVVYAGQAHSEQLPGGARKGYFVGDGTGVGKGREISGVILDNLAQGRPKAVWISCSEGLIEDARRDFAAVGGDPDLIFSQGRIKAGNAIVRERGILFTTYSTLRSGEKRQASDLGRAAGKTRLGQIVEWLGADFAGVIAFDEAHNMGNAMPVKGTRGTKKPAQQAITGLNLQRELPDARVLYVSATGATEVSNLTYAERLGLWGEGTAFADARAFIGQVSEGGIAAMELVARDMKALGVYAARSLSYEEVTYERLEHPLSDLQRAIYDELAGAWQIVLEHVDDALELTGARGNADAKGNALSMFWGTHQRFFNQVLTAFQTPAVIDHMRAQLEAGHAIIVQLVNTNEAAQERIVAAASAEGTALEDLDFTPRQMLVDYVRNGFPVAAFEQVQDPDGNTTWEPVTDSQGNPVFDQRAIALRDALLDTLQAIRVPENPLDSIINTFGVEQVAEVTGRRRRFVQVRDEEGDLRVVEEKRGKNAARLDADLYQGDQKRILIFSGAGGTGYSFHADNTAENRRRRIHYILQPGWAAQGAVQGFGRSHRTNQACAPHYVLPTTDLKAQKRFISSIARRLDQLGALTRGQRQASSQGLFTAADNLESHYARTALQNLFLDLYRQRTPLAFAEVTQQMGLNLRDENGTLAEGKIPGIPQFLNRLLSLKTDMQNAVFDEFEKRLIEAVEYAKQQGSYDEGLQTLRALRIEKTRDEVVYTHKTGAETRYVELAVTNEIPYLPWEEISQMALQQAQREGAQRSLSGWLVSEQGKTKGQVLYLLDRGLRLNAEGVESHRGTLYGIRKGAHRYIDNADEIARGHAMRQIDGRYREVQITRAIPPEEAERLWRAQLQAAPATETRREAMLVGAILPIWDRVAGGSTIYRLQTDAGEQLLGRRLGGGAAKQTLKNLGLDSGAAKLAASDLFAAIQAGQKAVLANGWEIVSVRVAHERRIEVRQRASFTEAEKRILKSQGAFVERISWAERVFIPVGAEGLGVFERITDSKPVVDLFGKASPEEAAAADAVEDDGALGYGAPDHPVLSPSADAHPATQPVAVHLHERRDMATNKTPYAEQVATKVIAQLQAGSAPWQMPWKPGELRLPYNAATGKGYRGMNTIWLQMQGHADPRWLTYRQAQAEGAQVRKGETGTRVIYWKFEDEQTMKDDQGRPVLDEEGQPRKIRVKLERPRSFSAVVFNAEQIDGLPALEARPVGPEPERHARAEAILDHCGAQIAYAPGGRRAFYRPSTDTITLPERSQFATAEGFYATALHEVGHASGHSSRLNRDLAHPFGSEGYAREELRAEIASLMLGERLEIGHDPSQHAAYVESWIKVLQEDPREIFRAAADAERITSYVMELEQEQTQAQRLGAEAVIGEHDQPVVQHQPPEGRATTAQRTCLAVPYREKDEAKRLGAKWDKEAKSWYAPEGVDVQQSGLARWLPESTHIVAEPKESPEASFATALRAAGLRLEGAPIMDGKLHRVPVEGERGGERSGAYAGHLDGRIPGGFIQNFKAGEQIRWKFEGTMDAVSPAEAARLEAEARERQAQRAARIAGQHARMATIATALWNEAEPATPDNPYCAAKGIAQPGENGLRVVPARVSEEAKALGVRIARDPREAKAMRAAEPDARVFMTGDLLVPARDGAGTLWSVQTVNPRFKGFMKEGRKAGLLTVAGARPEDLGKALQNDPAMALVLTEGYATGDTVARLAGQPVVVAFDSGNLDAVARELRQRWPDRPLLIAADNDHLAAKETLPIGKPRGNVGAAKAQQAAESHQGGVMLPRFAEGEQGSDWNDYAARHGDEAASKELARQMAEAKTEASMTAEQMLYLAREREAEAVNDPTTSADGVQVARERSVAQELMGRAVVESGEVRTQATNALAASATGQAQPVGSALAGIDREIGEMRDTVQEERLHVPKGQDEMPTSEQRPQKAQRRARGRSFDAGL